MSIIEDERTFSDMELKSNPAGADLLQIADAEDGGRVKKIPISALLAEDGTDANAIHVDVAAEIAGITAKAAPTVNDLAVIEDAAAANVKKRVVLGAIMKAVGWITGLTAKAAPVGADLVAIEDSEAAGAIKKIELATLLLASNNLSDVASGATSRANIGANSKNVQVGRLDMINANGDVLRYVHRGADLTLLSIDSSLKAAIDVDATITAAIDGVPVTTGVITVTAAGSAAGTKDQAVPSGANVMTAGQELTLMIGGGNTLASFADVAIYGTY